MEFNSGFKGLISLGTKKPSSATVRNKCHFNAFCGRKWRKPRKTTR